MDTPTHKDAFLSLLSSCLPCRSEPPALPPSPRLQALLTDPESDSDAMSLHSTYRPHTRRKKKKGVMQLCGVNLFGKSRGQIRLEEQDDEPINRPIQSSSTEDLEPTPRPRPRYDSDAAPLPDSTIHSLAISRSTTSTSPTTPTQPGPVQGYLVTNEQPMRKPESPEEELARLRAEKAARKARRKDRRERKARRQLQLEHTGEFEGYPGSGSFRDDTLPISPPSTTTSTPGIDEIASTRGDDDRIKVDDADPEDGEADMGAAVYTRSRPSLGSRSGSSSGTGTGTGTSMTGRTSTSGRRSSVGFSANNALGLGLQRPPPSPLTQSHVPTHEPIITSTPEPAVQEPVEPVEPVESGAPLVEPQAPELAEATPTAEVKQIPEPEPLSNAEISKSESVSNGKQPEDTSSPKQLESVLLPVSSSPSPPSSAQEQPAQTRPRPKIQLPNLGSNNLPMSSPGAGPGPRTMENSPRLAQPNLTNSPKSSGYGFPSPGLSRPTLGLGLSGFPSAGLGKPLGSGFPSPGLVRFLRPGSGIAGQVLGLAVGLARGEGLRLVDPRAREALRLGWGSRSLIGGISPVLRIKDQDEDEEDDVGFEM